jgi:hypothetical protein
LAQRRAGHGVLLEEEEARMLSFPWAFETAAIVCCGLGIVTGGTVEKRETIRDFEIVATLPKRTFSMGEPIPLTCEFRNNTDRNVRFWERGFYWNHLLTVRDENGREAPLTETGKEFRQSFSPNGDPGKTLPVTVGARSSYRSLSDDGVNNLRQLYHLRPGKYRVRVLLLDNREPGYNIIAKPVDFVVKP